MLRKTVSGIMLTVLLTSMLMLTFNIQPVKASGTIYIRADGSVEGTPYIHTSDNVTYVFTANINYDSIIVQRNDIILDGNGYTLQGTDGYNSTGIGLSGRTNVTVKNTQIQNFIFGILLDTSSNNTVSGNNVTNTNCAIELSSSSNNTVSGNNVVANRQFGIRLDFSSSNRVFGNNVTDNYDIGIDILSSSNNTIFENNVINSFFGIYIAHGYSLNNTVSGNNVTNNQIGISLDIDTNYNSISENRVTNNHKCGICLLSICTGNLIYHNNFIDNNQQVSIIYWGGFGVNVWDDGYPSGGNYWSDYTGDDLYSGPYQNMTGSDGIGDTPYIIDANNLDSYPLMSPYWYWSNPILGDLNKDMKVDLKDVYIAVKAFGSYPGHPRWSIQSDINSDGKVDLKDIFKIAINFGEISP